MEIHHARSCCNSAMSCKLYAARKMDFSAPHTVIFFSVVAGIKHKKTYVSCVFFLLQLERKKQCRDGIENLQKKIMEYESSGKGNRLSEAQERDEELKTELAQLEARRDLMVEQLDSLRRDISQQQVHRSSLLLHSPSFFSFFP